MTPAALGDKSIFLNKQDGNSCSQIFFLPCLVYSNLFQRVQEEAK